MSKFYADENIRLKMVQQMRAKGLDVETSPEANNDGRSDGAYAELANKGVKTFIDLRTPEEGTHKARIEAEAAGAKYYNIAVFGSDGISQAQVKEFAKIYEQSQGPVLVNCGSGNRVGAIQSSIDLVGKENVVVSFELNEALLNKSLDVVGEIQELRQQGNLGNTYSEAGWMYNTFPAFHAMEFAKSQGLDIVGSDPIRGKDFSSDSQERRDAEINALGKLVLKTVDTPKVVVHVGGEAHFVTLQGHPYNIDTSVYDDVTQHDAINPFEGIYGSQIFINSDQPVIEAMGRDIIAYMRNPENAIQLDPPGKMDTSDITDIATRIQAASSTLNVPQPEIPGSKIESGALNGVDTPKM